MSLILIEKPVKACFPRHPPQKSKLRFIPIGQSEVYSSTFVMEGVFGATALLIPSFCYHKLYFWPLCFHQIRQVGQFLSAPLMRNQQIIVKFADFSPLFCCWFQEWMNIAHVYVSRVHKPHKKLHAEYWQWWKVKYIINKWKTSTFDIVRSSPFLSSSLKIMSPL